VRLVGRNGHDWTGRVPTIAAALETLPPGTWVDGVVTWEDPSAGTANFARLSNGGLRDAANVTYRAFDVPFLAQEDLRLAPLDARKERLRDALATLRGPRVLPVDAIDGDDASLLAQACERGLEGIISKERESAYFGMRAGTWVKQACIGQDSFLLLGIAPEQGEGGGFALHVGHRSIGGLVIYDGLVIGGFDADAIARIEAHVAKHASAKPELFLATGRKVDPKKYARGAWCEPTLVLEVTFVRRVAGLLRQARFKGFREDIEAAELVR
jgi:bifunctional non-homologous end joining protein LigD